MTGTFSKLMILTMKKVLFLVIMLFSLLVPSTAKEVPFTQEDRDRLIRVEVKVEAVEKRMDGLERLRCINHPFWKD